MRKLTEEQKSKYLELVERRMQALQKDWDEKWEAMVDQMTKDTGLPRVFCEGVLKEELSDQAAWMAILPSPH